MIARSSQAEWNEMPRSAAGMRVKPVFPEPQDARSQTVPARSRQSSAPADARGGRQGQRETKAVGRVMARGQGTAGVIRTE